MNFREPALRRQLRRAIVVTGGLGVLPYAAVVPDGWVWPVAYMAAAALSWSTLRRVPRPSAATEATVGVGMALGLAFELWRTQSMVLAPGNILAVVLGLLTPRAQGVWHRRAVAGGVVGHCLAATPWVQSGGDAAGYVAGLLALVGVSAWTLAVAYRAAVVRTWEADGATGAAARLAEAGTGRGHVGGAIWIAASALLLAAATFVLTPRPAAGARTGRSGGAGGPGGGLPGLLPPRPGKTQITGLGGRNVSGFRDQVDFADLGPIKQDPRIALRVRVADQQGAPVQTGEPLLLRGVALNHYAHGRWTAAEVGSRTFRDAEDGATDGRTAIGAPPPDARFWRQRIEPVTLQAAYCFHVGRLLAAETPELVYDDNGTAALRAAPTAPYHVWSLPHRRRAAARSAPTVTRSPAFLQIPWTSTSARVFLTRLRTALAGAERRPYRLARALERGLRKRFKYTLSVKRPAAGTEPLVPFMRGTQPGHCEYFASTMVLLLRSAGVPARLVGGFRASEFDAARGEYIVRHRDAHAWVEVRFDRLGWVSFDPTPADSAAGGPVQITPPPRPGADLEVALQDPGFFDRVLAFDAGDRAALLSRSGGWWGVLLVAGLAGLLALAGLRGWQRFAPALARHRAAAGERRRHPLGRPAPPAFFAVLQRTLAAAGFRRGPSGTARELALAVRRGHGPAPRAVDKVVRTFEAVRYGRRTLTAETQQQLQRLLDEIAAAARP